MSVGTKVPETTWQQKAQDSILSLILLIAVVVPVLAFPSNQEMQGIANKAIQVMVAFLAGALILSARLPRKSAEIVRFLAHGPNIFVLLYLLSAVLSIFVIPPLPGARRLGIQSAQGVLAGVLLYFAVSYHIRKGDALTKISDYLSILGGVMAIVGIGLQVSQQTGRANLFGDSQLFGGFLMILLPLAVIQSFTQQNFSRKIIAQVCAVLMIAGMLMSGLRSSWIGSIAILVSLSLLSLIGSQKGKRAANIKTRYLFPILTIIASCVFVGLQSDVLKMVTTRVDAGEQTLIYRQKYWKAALTLFQEKPLLGQGTGMYALLQFPHSGQGRPQEAVLQTRPALSESAHNMWLKTLSEQGLVGIIALAGIMISFWIAGVLRLKTLTSEARRAILLASLAGTFGFAIDAVTNPCWEFAQIAIFFWLLLGMGSACLHSRNKDRPDWD